MLRAVIGLIAGIDPYDVIFHPALQIDGHGVDPCLQVLQEARTFKVETVQFDPQPLVAALELLKAAEFRELFRVVVLADLLP